MAMSKRLVTIRAVDGRWADLLPIHFLQPSAAEIKAGRALRKVFQIPEVGEDASAVQRQSVFRCLLEHGNGRGRKLAVLSEGIEGAVAQTGWDERNRARAAPEGKLHRTQGPQNRFIRFQKRRMNEEKRAESDLMFFQKFCRILKLFECHSLIQSGQHLRMGCFESHGNFQRGMAAV